MKPGKGKRGGKKQQGKKHAHQLVPPPTEHRVEGVKLDDLAADVLNQIFMYAGDKGELLGLETNREIACTCKYFRNLLLASITHLMVTAGRYDPFPESLLKCRSSLTSLWNLSIWYSGMVMSVPAIKSLSTFLNSHLGIRELDLSLNEIGPDGIIALRSALSTLKNLQYLDLHDNSLGTQGACTLAVPLKHLTALTHLDVSCNCIGPRGAQALARSMENLSLLESADLSFNDFGSNIYMSASERLRPFATCFKMIPNLRILDMSTNRVDGSLISCMPCFTALQTLGLRDNSFTEKSLIELAPSWSHLISLQDLDVSDNSFRWSNGGLDQLIKPLNNITTLRALNVGEISCHSNASSASDELKRLTRLQKLVLLGTESRPLIYHNSLTSVKRLTALQHLDLSYAASGDQSARVLTSTLWYLTGLKFLSLEGNHYEEHSEPLAKAFSRLETLEHLSMSATQFESHAVAAWAGSLRHLRMLTHLDVSYTSWPKPAIEALTTSARSLGSLKHFNCSHMKTSSRRINEGSVPLLHMLRYLPKLEHLEAENITIGDDALFAIQDETLEAATAASYASGYSSDLVIGVVYMSSSQAAWCQSITMPTQLTQLVLRNTGLGNTEASALARPLTHMRNLEQLDVSHNNIEDSGAKAIGQSLMYLTNLGSLDMSRNKVCNAGAVAIAAGLKHLAKLETLDLIFNSIGGEGAVAVADSVQQLPVFTRLGMLSGNPVDNAAMAYVRSAQREPPSHWPRW